MNKSISLLVTSLLLISITTFAQTETIKRDRFTLNITNPSEIKEEKTKKELVEAFFATYPQFSRADGYRTKRDVILEIKDGLTDNIVASEGKIIINSNWLANNSSKLEKELRHSLSKNWVSSDTIKKKGYQLVFISKDPDLDQEVKKNLIATYFKVYPKLVKIYNKKSTKDVLFVVDTAYKAVAEASGGRILFSAAYLKAHPTDIDVVTHETMHIAQGYGYSAGPVWLTEGIADYVRYKHGVDNIGSKWSLPNYNEKQSYTNSYRITARFFVWLEKKVTPGLIAKLDLQLRERKYTEQSWVNLTGKTLAELWDAYGKSPAVELTYSGKETRAKS